MCGTTCNPGFTNNGTACIRTSTRRHTGRLCRAATCILTGQPPRGPPPVPSCHFVANVPKLVTVQTTAPSVVCAGTQTGYYSSSPDVTCTSCQQGPASTSNLCGTSFGVPTYCCYRPTFFWAAAPNPQPTPSSQNIQAYPYIALPIPASVHSVLGISGSVGAVDPN